jgi:peptide alpha-N-acetyltransferase
LWALYFQCHFLELFGDLTQALAVIEEAIAHTPTALDMHGKRARLLKKQGDLANAAIAMDDCRQLDLQDRYLNNKATKYFLRADETALAMNTIALFTKHEGDPQQTLYELQCNWYELELAEAYFRTRQWGPALRKFYAIRKHFTDYNDDMFDFHGYCMRKVSPIARLLRLYSSFERNRVKACVSRSHHFFLLDYHSRPPSGRTSTRCRCWTSPSRTSFTSAPRAAPCGSSCICTSFRRM